MTLDAVAQVQIGEWRAHVSYRKGLKSIETPDRVYCGTENGVFYVNREDNSFRTLSKVDGLSGVNLATIDYDPLTGWVFIAYEGGLVDMIQGTEIVPIPYIANAGNIFGDKSVTNFSFHDKLAYLSTSFGIVVYDIENRQIKESYINLNSRGNKLAINDVAVFNGRVYASSPEGLRSGDINDNLLDFRFWRTDVEQPCGALVAFGGKLIFHLADNRMLEFDGTTSKDFEPVPWCQVRHMDQQNDQLVITNSVSLIHITNDFKTDSIKVGAQSHCLLDNEGIVWTTNGNNGLVKYSDPVRYLVPNGPNDFPAWDFGYLNGEMWVASGGVDLLFQPRFINAGIYVFRDQKWGGYNGTNTSEISRMRDFHRVRIDEANQRKYFASYNRGIVMFDAENKAQVFDESNSNGVLGGPTATDQTVILTAGIDLDSQGNLWMCMQYVENQMGVRTSKGEWQSYNLGSEKRVDDILVDDLGQKWVTIHLDGIYVMDDGGTIMDKSDDRVRKLDQGVGSGNLPSPDVYSFVMDSDGDVWLGTGDGVAVIRSPENIFDSDQSFDAQRPQVQEGDALGYLLEGQRVNCITIDGANQKWFGTDNGVFATNEDGDEILYRFNVDNSPLFSNVIRRIGVDDKTGEVFMATDKGIISYRAEATEGKEVHEGVYAFPNPVRPGYDGPIAVTGLVENANVKFTDLAGNLVYETTAQGGTAVWYGKTFGGNEVASGVYLAFSSNRSGEETYIAKIMIIR